MPHPASCLTSVALELDPISVHGFTPQPSHWFIRPEPAWVSSLPGIIVKRTTSALCLPATASAYSPEGIPTSDCWLLPHKLSGSLPLLDSEPHSQTEKMVTDVYKTDSRERHQISQTSHCSLSQQTKQNYHSFVLSFHAIPQRFHNAGCTCFRAQCS
ncbi:hypothetical protein AMECASPLE_008957 [Ameca splendens]|uniref:Uncharacterized protein n=1 Tax=Ameca splendens TaxID=208324 RepID=A0ABV0XD76_9TELE